MLVSHLDVSLLVYEQVLGLQVSVDQVQSVQVLKGQDDLGGVKPGVRLTVMTRTGVKERWARVSRASAKTSHLKRSEPTLT